MGVGNAAIPKCSHSNQQAKQLVINLTFCHANTETTEREKVLQLLLFVIQEKKTIALRSYWDLTQMPLHRNFMHGFCSK
jgi:hypothetical protein